MNPKTLLYLMGHLDISVTMNVCTHIGLDNAEKELKWMEEFQKAQVEVEKKNDAKAVSQKIIKVINYRKLLWLRPWFFYGKKLG